MTPENTTENTNTASRTFTIGDSISFGWDRFKANIGVTIGAIVIIWLISIIFNIVSEMAMRAEGVFAPFGFGALLASYVVSVWLGYNMIKMFIKMSGPDSVGKTKVNELFRFDKGDEKRIFMYFLGCIVYGLVIAVGLLLLILPGIYFAVKYSFAPYLMIDKNMGIADAFRKSGEMTEGHIMKLIGVVLMSMLIMLLGLLLLVVGIIPATIVIYFMYTYTYKKLLGEATASL